MFKPYAEPGPVTVRATALLVPLLGTAGIAALYATHEQIDPSLTEMLATLANQGRRTAVLVADGHFDGHALARRVQQPEQLQVAFGETPRQVRFLVQRLLKTREAYSVVVVIGLLETFYDEQVRAGQAYYVLADTLRGLNDLARTLRVLILITPVPKPTRPQLQQYVRNAVDAYIEIPALPAPESFLPGRLC